MLRSRLWIAAVWLFLAAGSAAADSGFLAITASSVEALHGDYSSVQPPVAGDTTFLGQLGPLGAMGPLGPLGPLGHQSWNVSAFLASLGDWWGFSKLLTSWGGPLSEAGPLGPGGPLGRQAYERALPKHFQMGGIWGVLGPAGPLGCLGPLGPLGPAGAEGSSIDSAGRHVHDGKVKRTVLVGEREFEICELYREAFAKAMPDNDTSFMVEGELSPPSETDEYAFTSRCDQFVSVVVVPESTLDACALDVRGAGGLLASSASSSLVNWVILHVRAGTSLKARVHLVGGATGPARSYRLIVTGSGEAIDQTDIRGKHQLIR